MSNIAESQSPDRATLAAYALTVLLAGANAVAVRFTVAELRPFWGAAIRFTASAAIFFILMLLRRSPMPMGRALAGVLLYGVLSFGVSYAFLYWGLQTVPAGLTQVILALVPLMTFFAAVAHGLETFRWRGLVGAVLCVAGIAYAFFEQPQGAMTLLPVLSIVAGAISIAESTVVVKMFPPADPMATNALGMGVGSVILFMLSLLNAEPWILPTRSATWASILYLVLIGSVVVFYLFLFIVRRWTASATSYQFVLFPFVTVLLAGWLAGEQVNAGFLIGGALVLLGVWIGALARDRAPRNAT